MAEREGFEPSVPPFSGTRDFQSRSFGPSDISPHKYISKLKRTDSNGGEGGIRTHVPCSNRAKRFRVAPVTTTSVPLHPRGSPPFTKKSLNELPTLFFHYTGHYLNLMIQSPIRSDPIKGRCASPSLILCAKYKPLNPCMYQGPHTHRTWLYSYK